MAELVEAKLSKIEMILKIAFNKLRRDPILVKQPEKKAIA